MRGRWRSDEVLAYTTKDGPDPAPRGLPPAAFIGLAGILAVTAFGLVVNDTLCPEHRALVEVLGIVAVFGAGSAVLGLMRGWASSPALTLLGSTAGLGLGAIDLAHDPSAGRLVILAFAIATVGASYLWLRQVGMRWWDRSLRPTTPEQPVISSSPSSPEVSSPAEPQSDPEVPITQ
jgi:hypothetical protein